jgi:hypothetical protein
VAVNKRKTLLARIVTPGGDDPLLLRLVAPVYIPNGVPVSGIALVGQGGAGGYAYSLLTGSAYGTLPPGLTLNADGTITGTPSGVGVYSFVAQVQDANSSVYTASFSLTIKSRLLIGKPLPGPGEVDLPYFGSFRVVGATGTVTWTQLSGNLPAGLSMDSAGRITGTPTADSSGLGGISYFTVQASDSGTGDTLDVPHKIKIFEKLTVDFPARTAPMVTPVGVANMQPAIAGITNTFPLTIEGGASPYKVVVSAVTPPTLKIGYDANNVAVRIRPGQSDIGWIFYTATVTDALGAIAIALFSQYVIEGAALQPQENGVDVGDVGPNVVNFEDGANTTVDVTNVGGVLTVKVNSTGGGGGGPFISSINGVTPDSSGDIDIVGAGGASISINSAGQIVIYADSDGGGGVGSVGGATPDSSGNVGIGSSDASIIAVVDSNGDLDLTVSPATRGPMAGFGNGSIILSGTLTVEIPAMKYAGTITGWHIVGDASGDVAITVSHSTFAAYNTMTTLFTANCSGAIKASATGLSQPFSAGDVMRFSATGFAGFTRCAIVLDVA